MQAYLVLSDMISLIIRYLISMVGLSKISYWLIVAYITVMNLTYIELTIDTDRQTQRHTYKRVTDR